MVAGGYPIEQSHPSSGVALSTTVKAYKESTDAEDEDEVPLIKCAAGTIVAYRLYISELLKDVELIVDEPTSLQICSAEPRLRACPSSGLLKGLERMALSLDAIPYT